MANYPGPDFRSDCDDSTCFAVMMNTSHRGFPISFSDQPAFCKRSRPEEPTRKRTKKTHLYAHIFPQKHRVLWHFPRCSLVLRIFVLPYIATPAGVFRASPGSARRFAGKCAGAKTDKREKNALLRAKNSRQKSVFSLHTRVSCAPKVKTPAFSCRIINLHLSPVF